MEGLRCVSKRLSESLRVLKLAEVCVMSEQAQQGTALLSIPYSMSCLSQHWYLKQLAGLHLVAQVVAKMYNRCKQDILHSFIPYSPQHTEQLLPNQAGVVRVVLWGGR